jgi:hypothetical protein
MRLRVPYPWQAVHAMGGGHEGGIAAVNCRQSRFFQAAMAMSTAKNLKT